MLKAITGSRQERSNLVPRDLSLLAIACIHVHAKLVRNSGQGPGIETEPTVAHYWLNLPVYTQQTCLITAAVLTGLVDLHVHVAKTMTLTNIPSQYCDYRECSAGTQVRRQLLLKQQPHSVSVDLANSTPTGYFSERLPQALLSVCRYFSRL